MKKGLRVVLITSSVSSILLAIFASNHPIVGVIQSSPHKKKKSSVGVKIFGLIQSIYNFFMPNKSLSFFCDKNKIPYLNMQSKSDGEIKQWITRLSPDIIVVYSMSQLLKEAIFSLPRYGSINLHASFLPDYRGPNPEFWQCYYTDLFPGVTVHHIDKGEDTGDIIFQERHKIKLGLRSYEKKEILIDRLGARLVVKSLDSILDGTAPRLKQAKLSSTQRARKIKSNEHAMLIDWTNWSSERIWHILRGTEEWFEGLRSPSRFLPLRKWKIGEIISCNTTGLIRGGIYRDGNSYFVVCRDGKIQLSIEFSFKQMLTKLLIYDKH